MVLNLSCTSLMLPLWWYTASPFSNKTLKWLPTNKISKMHLLYQVRMESFWHSDLYIWMPRSRECVASAVYKLLGVTCSVVPMFKLGKSCPRLHLLVHQHVYQIVTDVVQQHVFYKMIKTTEQKDVHVLTKHITNSNHIQGWSLGLEFICSGDGNIKQILHHLACHWLDCTILTLNFWRSPEAISCKFLVCNLWNHWSDLDGLSAKCTSPNENFNQIENWKCHMFDFRLVPLDRIT